MGRRMKDYSLWCRKDSNKTFYARPAHGSWVSTGYTNRKKAITWCDERWGEGPKASKIDDYTPVREVISRYFTGDDPYTKRMRRKHRCGESHRKRCQLRIRQILEDEKFSARPIRKVGITDTEPFIDRMVEKGHSPHVIRQMYDVLLTVGNEELRKGELSKNVFRGADNLPDLPPTEVGVLSIEEMNSLFGKPQVFGDHQMYVFFRTLQLTAARRSEALALLWKDINFQKRMIIFARAQKNNDGSVVGPLKMKKPGATRKVRMSETLTTLLREHRKNSEFKMPGCRVFGRPQDNSPLRWSFVNSRWKTALKRAGITRRVGVHGLRHSVSSALADSGVDPAAIREISGWADESIRERYRHFIAGQTQTGPAAVIDGLFGGHE